MNHKIKYALGLALTMGLLWSCSQEESVNPVSDYSGQYLDFVNVVPGTRDGLDVGNDAPVTSINTILQEEFVEGQSVLYISQLTDNIVPFAGVTGEESGPEYNLYKYTYGQREIYPNPSWTEGYNFFPNNKGDMVDWEFVGETGPFGNGYALCALYFPYSNMIQEFKVEDDQSTADALRKSNILGAKHTNSSLYTRLQFRLWHLMTNLNLTVYVPVFRDGDKNSQTDTVPSGYFANSLQGAEIIDVYTTYSINFKTRAGELAPYTRAITDETGNKVAALKMYRHPYGTENGEPQKKIIRIRDFLPESEIPESAQDYDTVYMYKFSALIPAGQVDGFFNGNFLRFPVLNTVGNNVIKNYVFNGSQEYNENAENSGLFLSSEGSQQNIELYLPRKGSEVLLVNAEVIDWTEASSDMFVNPPPVPPSNPGGGTDTGDGDGEDNQED